MKDLTPEAIAGSWRGRLVDVGGLEGEVDIELSAGRGKAGGTVVAAIGANHESERYRLKVSGEYGGKSLHLSGTVDGRGEVGIDLNVEVFELAGGGFGLCGTYSVSSREFAPLRVGVITASKGERMTATEIQPDVIMNRRDTAEVRR